MWKIITHLLTGKDNQTWDLGRVSWSVSTLAILANHWYLNIFKDAKVSSADLALALSAICAAHGAALGLKAKTEPEPGGNQS